MKFIRQGLITMSIVKIQKVKDLKAVINYSMQAHKTNEELVTSYEC